MADAFTQVSSLSGIGTAAHQRLAYFALRPQLHYDQIADVKPTNQTHPGGTVLFYIYADLAEATSALTETVDPDAVALSDSTVTVTLVEYGNAIRTTAKARGTDLLEVDADGANIIGFNAGQSIDTIARTEVNTGTNVLYAGDATSTATVDKATSDWLTAAMFRNAVADLRTANSMPVDGTYYMAHIHPDQSVDLRAETGAGGWAEPANRSLEGIRRWQGMVGTFEGTIVVESPRVEIDADGGVTTTDVYLATVVGRQALAKAFSAKESGEVPQVRFGPQVDKLRRFNSIGWYWLGGYKRFREASIQRMESASSIGAD